MEYVEKNERYKRIGERLIEKEKSLEDIRLSDVRIDYLSSDREKTNSSGNVLGECIKVKDVYKVYTDADFLIVLYEPNVEHLSDKQLEILIHHELLHVGIGENDGEPRYLIRPHDVEDFAEIIKRYGVDWAHG